MANRAPGRDAAGPGMTTSIGAGMHAVETETLTKRFRRLGGYRDLLSYSVRPTSHLAVDALTFQVRTGELFGLLGENGAGKSTLIRMLTTTLIPTEGHARVAGFDVVEHPHAVRQRVGLVAGNERSFYWRISGRQNLEFFAALYRLPPALARRRIGELAETLSLDEYLDQRFSTYSTGIRQRFAIARGLLTEPAVLFLDEPTSALDPIAADGVRRYIKEHIQGELGTTIVMATHTLSEAETLCDRVAILRHGQVVAAGTVRELRAEMRLFDVLELEARGDAAKVDGALRALDGFQALELVVEGDSTRVRIPLDEGRALLTSALEAILTSGLQVTDVVTRQPTLDDVYRAAHAD